MKIIAKFSRSKVAAGIENHVGLLIKLRAPAPSAQSTRPPLCIVPVVDVSGSMAGPKLASVQKALTQLVAHLLPGDHMGLVAFDSDAHVLSPIVEVTEARKKDLLALVTGLRAGSNTNLAGGLIEGARMVQAFSPSQSMRVRVILLTDGQANTGAAKTPAELVKLVQDEVRTVAVSAFGYGEDCDHSILGDIASAAGGSFAYIKNDDAVMTAFAREIGGLLSTYATGIKLCVRSASGTQIIQDVGELLFHGEQPAYFDLTVPAHAVMANTEAATVEVSWKDGRGRAQSAQTVVRLDHVTAEHADAAEDPEIVRARDENVLRHAQEKAELHAQKADYVQAREAIEEAIRKIQDVALLAFANSVLLACYGGESAYSGGSAIRASSRAALANRRQIIAAEDVAVAFQVAPSAAERAMETSFRSRSARVRQKSPVV